MADKPKRDPDYLLGELLKNVSRSFYLTLRVLPGELRGPVGLAYLLARAADTIADTALVSPQKRLEYLLAFRMMVNEGANTAQINDIEAALTEQQRDSHERVLLQSLQPALELLQTLSESDRKEVCSVVTTLTRGMEMDLNTFPLESSGKVVALKNKDELDRYTFLVAGCVGEFWTKMTVAHTPALKKWNVEEMSACGIRFGKALQFTNVLRDCPKDLRIGRCYLPADMLSAAGLKPEDLLKPENAAKARPILCELLRTALDHYREAERYLLAIPRRCGRLRLACLWPVLIGLATLKKQASNKDWLDPKKVSKVSRGYVKRTLAISLPAVASNTVVRGWIDGMIKDVERSLE